MEAIKYRITEGSEYHWTCFGENVHQIDSGKHNQYTICVTFDTVTQHVYELQAWDYVKDKTYRWIDPAYVKAYKKECKKHNVGFKNAFDDVDYIDLELAEDLLEKAHAMVEGVDYDERVSVPLTLEDDVLFELMKRAHEADMSLNNFVEHVLETEIAIRRNG